MAHYSFIDSDNLVVEVIVGKDENDTETLPEEYASWEEYYETKRDGLTCKRTSYNTAGNQHLDGGEAFRGNYAGIGYSYDEENDVFIPPQPYPSWTLNESTWSWKCPVDFPEDTEEEYQWNEEDQTWDLVE